MVRRKVVLTGASGYIAQRMLAELEARYDLVLLDARPTTRNGKTVPVCGWWTSRIPTATAIAGIRQEPTPWCTAHS